MTTNTTYRIVPISAADADTLRERGGPVFVADEHPGYPCRQCLLDAEIGDELILVSHDPFAADSPYRSASPIFLHRNLCGSTIPDGLPTQLTGRQLSVRAFDADEMMIDAAVIDGNDLDDTIRRFLSDDSADHLHIHNATRGCWAAAVSRA
jgi:hypothetical protein